MTAPSIEDSTNTGITTAETTSALALPATVSAGALIIMAVRCPVAGAIGWPGDWTELWEDASDGSDDVAAAAWHAADGSEGGTTINVTHGSGKICSTSHSITGAENPTTQPPEFSTVAFANSQNPDADTLSPTGGSKDYLWFSVCTVAGEVGLGPTWPANYTLHQQAASTGTGGVATTNCRVFTSARQLTTATEDPGAMTISGAVDWMAWTIAVHPAGAAAPTSIPFKRKDRLYLPARDDDLWSVSGWL